MPPSAVGYSVCSGGPVARSVGGVEEVTEFSATLSSQETQSGFVVVRLSLEWGWQWLGT